MVHGHEELVRSPRCSHLIVAAEKKAAASPKPATVAPAKLATARAGCKRDQELWGSSYWGRTW